MLKAAFAALIVLAGSASIAAARSGDAHHPIALKMKRGTYGLTVHGVLRQGDDCCTYSFKAHAGQRLIWTETGAAARIGLTNPDGASINPGLPSPADLPQTGTYILSIHPDLMADGAFGRFTFKLRIPPR